MNCIRVLERLSPFLEGDLSEREERRLSQHFATCRSCRIELERLRRTVQLLHSWPPPEAPADLAARVAERVAREDAARPWAGAARWLERTLSAGWLAPVGAAAIGMAVFSWVQALDVSLTREGGLAQAVAPGVPRVARIAPPSPLPEAMRPVARVATSAPAPGGARPSMGACVAGRPGGAPADPEACAAWYAWFVGLALDDAPVFLDEVDQVPNAQRDPWLRELSSFAARSGSAALVGRRLRSSPDPRATPVASRFERSAPVQARPVGFERR